MLGKAQASARAARAHGASGGCARSFKPAESFLRKISPLFVAIALIVSMLPTPALASASGEGRQDASSAAVEQAASSADEVSGKASAGDGAAEGGLPGAAAQEDVAGAAGSNSSSDAGSDSNSDADADADGAADADAAGQGGASDADATDAVGPEAPQPSGGELAGAAGSAGEQPAAIEVKCGVIGPDAAGNAQAWAAESTFAMKEGDAADALIVAALERAKLVADYDPEGPYGFSLNSITSPFDGCVLGWDAATGKYWQLFVNGEASELGASSVALAAGDVVTLAYTAFGESIPEPGAHPATIEAKCRVVGVDAAGNAQVWASEDSFKMEEGATAAAMTVEMFERHGIAADYDPDGACGFYLKTITSPFDGRVLGRDAATGKYWQLFVNGEASEIGAGSVALAAGDVVTWAYAAYGASLPSEGDLVVDPSAPRPELDAGWPGFAGGSAGPVVTAPTPTDGTQAVWTYDFKGPESWATVSDPLIVDGDVYIVARGKIQRIDGDTGKLERSAPTGESTQYICRPAYADGLIIVPFDGGKVAAYTADTLTCVWKTPSFAPEGAKAPYQALSSPTVANGCVYVMFSPSNGNNPTVEGVMACVSLEDGSALWVKRTGAAAQESAGGFYWAGAAVSGDDLIVGDDLGKIALVDGESGAELSSVVVSGSCRAGIVAVQPSASGQGEYLAVTQNDGTLHKIERVGDELRAAGSVKFAVSSTSTPAVAQGKAVVCGSDSAKYPVNGTVSVIDVATMTLESSVVAGSGQSQSSPLISVQGDGVYAYFTCNSNPGGVYSYKLGDDKAYQLFVPEKSMQNFCAASVVADAAGNLYYTNDSGTLFKLSAAPSFAVVFETNGGSAMSALRVAQNKPMGKPIDPVREGHLFMGWFADEQLTQPWDFSAPVAGDMTLYAKWGEDVNAGGDVKPPIDPDELRPSAPEGGISPSNPSVTVVPTYTVVTTRTPLADVKQDAAASAAPDGKAAPVASGGSGSYAAARGGSAGAVAAGPEVASATLNPIAVAGIALGVVVLLGVALYFAFARRRA